MFSYIDLERGRLQDFKGTPWIKRSRHPNNILIKMSQGTTLFEDVIWFMNMVDHVTFSYVLRKEEKKKKKDVS